MVKRILRGLLIGLAIVILVIEDAVWTLFGPLADALARLDLVVRAERWIRRQRPWLIAVLFLVPTGIVYPLKLWGLALAGFGHPRTGLILFFGAEIVGALLLARLWIIGRDKLLTIGWLARVYGWIETFRERVYGWVRRQPAWVAASSAMARVRGKVAVWLRP